MAQPPMITTSDAGATGLEGLNAAQQAAVTHEVLAAMP